MNALAWHRLLVRIGLGLASCVVCLGGYAVTPAPDGGYAGNNTAEGTSALFGLTSGIDNTGLGFQALYHATTGNYNTAEGFRALFSNTTGVQNTATGVNALINNTTGNFDTATGVNTLFFNTTGSQNTATGVQALFHNTTGVSNTAVGVSALRNNTTAAFNTAVGHDALVSNNADRNAAFGYQALYSNTTGVQNTAYGFQALFNNTTGGYNTANGYQALYSNSNFTGAANTATGAYALFNNTGGPNNTAVGYQALYSNTFGELNTAIGFEAGSNVTGSGNVCIGYFEFGVAGEDNTTHISNIYSSVASDRAVYVNAGNKIGTLASSRRYKEEIEPMNKASEAILALKPVTFRYKQEFNPNHTPMFGLIAEEVEKVNPNLVTRNNKGEAETVRYDAINAMLLNEFLKAHKKMEEQEKTIAELKSSVEILTAQVRQQSEQIQKVSASVGLNRAGSELAANR